MSACHAAKDKAAPARRQASPESNVQSAAPAPVSLRAPAGGHCACGGGCPRCQAGAGLRLGRHDSAEEATAERTARRATGLAARHGRLSDDAALLSRVDARAPLRAQAGQALAPALRRPLEARLGRDFSAVRLHRGASADATAAALQASAYALGPDIVLGRGAPPLHTPAGQHLLAHELAHTAQADAAHTVRRLPSDYEINGLPLFAAGDSSTIYFERGQSAIPASEQTKIAALATPATRNLTLHGFASEDAAAADRAARVNDRLAAVEAALVAAGHTGTRARVAHPDDGVGNIDYRSMRSVQVLPTPVGSAVAPTAVNPCLTPGSAVASGAELTTCEASFTAAHPTALAVVNRAERDIVTTPTPAANALVARFFAGVPRADVNATVSAVAAQVRRQPAAHACHTACDGGCDRPAYNSGHGTAARPAGALTTLCPDFVTASLDFRINTLIHEAAHGTASGTIDDIAYHNTRLVPFLLAADSRRNTDSYVLLMRLVHTPGSMLVGPASADTLSGMTAVGAGSDTEQAQRAVAWLESWLNYGGFDTSILHATLDASLRAGAWVTTGTHEFNIETQHRLALAFPGDFTDPGADGSPRTTPPAPAPTNTDKLRVAALRDRYVDLYGAVNQRAITITRGAPGSSDTWANSASRPYLLPTVTLSPAFFGASRADQVRRLAAAMVRAHRDISLAFEPRYVDALDRIHTHRRLGP